MANKNIFSSPRKQAPVADTLNEAGGKAFKFEKKHALAQIACTNCFNGTFYASASDNLEVAKEAAQALRDDPEFLAKVAIFSRTRGYMKDMPAFLTVVLSEVDKPLFRKVFRKVVNNGKMLRNVVQMARSGAVTKKSRNMSAGTYRHAIQEWFRSRSAYALMKASIGQDPSMRDILRMSRPKPSSVEQSAMFAYLLGKEVGLDSLPKIVREYENWKRTKEGPVPNVDFRLLDSLGLNDENWLDIARNAPWMMTRMNLNTFARHNVFKNKSVTDLVAARLRDKELIKNAGAFPYQLFSAWKATNDNSEVPFVIKEALQDAAEIAIDNVPEIEGKVIVCVDCSGSMGSPVTGSNGKATTVTCSDVAGLIASSIVRKNRSSDVYTFNSVAVKVNLNPRDTVLTNTQKLNKAGGGTDCSAALRTLNKNKVEADVIVYVSDYESWLDSDYHSTGMQSEWTKFKKNNPKAKLVCIDLTPRSNSQVKEHKDVLQVGGFSDQVFDVVASFVKHGMQADHWVSEIENVSLDDDLPEEEE